MTITALALIFGVRVYSFDVAAYVINPKILSYSLAMVFSALAILTIILSKFHNFLLTSISQANERTAQLTKESVVRHEAEKARRKSDDKFYRIVENFQDVYFETAMEGSIHYCSPSCLAISDYTQDELIGKNATVLYFNQVDLVLLDMLMEPGINGQQTYQ